MLLFDLIEGIVTLNFYQSLPAFNVSKPRLGFIFVHNFVCMKNGSLVLNIILLVAVAVLFYLHFSSRNKTEQAKVVSSQAGGSVPRGDFRIAYFEMDSINNSFAMVKDVKTELTSEEEKINNELTRLQRSYNDKLVQLQNSQQANSQIQSEGIQREIMQLRDKITSRKQDLDQKYQNLYMRKMQDVKGRIESFLQEYNKSKGYTYILAYEPGFMFYRDSAYNITNDLVKGLNEQYKKK